MSLEDERCIALAGVFQAGAEVRRLGREGNAGTAALETTISSLFIFDPPSVEAVFSGLEGLGSGLPALRNFLLQRPDKATGEVNAYALGLLRLERKVNAAPGKLAAVRADLEELVDLGLAAEPGDPRTMKRLADTYVRHISDLGPKIMVKGEPAYLNAPGNPERIRAFLLGGLRAAVLWRQLGGTRLKLVFSRRSMARATASLLARPVAVDGTRTLDQTKD